MAISLAVSVYDVFHNMEKMPAMISTIDIDVKESSVSRLFSIKSFLKRNRMYLNLNAFIVCRIFFG